MTPTPPLQDSAPIVMVRKRRRRFRVRDLPPLLSMLLVLGLLVTTGVIVWHRTRDVRETLKAAPTPASTTTQLTPATGDGATPTLSH